MTDTQTHYRTCNICEAMCGLEIQYRGSEILSIKGDSNDPFSHGHIVDDETTTWAGDLRGAHERAQFGVEG